MLPRERGKSVSGICTDKFPAAPQMGVQFRIDSDPARVYVRPRLASRGRAASRRHDQGEAPQGAIRNASQEARGRQRTPRQRCARRRARQAQWTTVVKRRGDGRMRSPATSIPEGDGDRTHDAGRIGRRGKAGSDAREEKVRRHAGLRPAARQPQVPRGLQPGRVRPGFFSPACGALSAPANAPRAALRRAACRSCPATRRYRAFPGTRCRATPAPRRSPARCR